jgi:hypothetical protein
MTSSWQDIAALSLVAAAIVCLMRRVRQVLAEKRRQGCGGCGTCPTANADPATAPNGAPLVTIRLGEPQPPRTTADRSAD